MINGRTSSTERGRRGVRLPFRPDLEGLRGVAILLVVAYHAGVPGFSGGYVGVDVFFVLSGYLITGLLVKELDATGRLNLVEFYARRARRLLPAATLVLIVTLIAARLFYAPFQQLGFTGTAIATAAYISNVWFAKESTDYLAADSAVNPFLHTWSLSVEEQFYLVWPLLLVATTWWGAASARHRRMIAAMSILAVVSLAAGIWLTRVAQPLAFFSSPTRAWEFAVGGLGALFAGQSDRHRGVLTRTLSWVGMGAVLGAAVFFDRTTVFPGVAALIPVLGVVGVLTFQNPMAPTRLTAMLSGSLLQWFGRLSYSWYLWHWPVLKAGEVLLGDLGVVVRLSCAGVALLLAWITFHVLEHPIRSSKSLAVRPRLSLAMAACLTATSLAVSINARSVARLAADTPAQRAFTFAWQDIPRVYPLRCHLGYLQAELNPCWFGENASDTTIVLFGDSHAAQWFPALERMAIERRWRLASLTKSACPAATVDRIDPLLGRQYVECNRWRETAIGWIVAIHPRAVIMASASLYVTATRDKLPGGVTSAHWLTGTRQTLSQFSKAGVSTLLLRDTPRPGFDVPGCLARAAWSPMLFSRSCDFDRGTSLDELSFAAETQAAAEFRDVRVADLTDTICGSAQRRSKSQGLVVYRDTDHLTTRFAIALEPLVAAELDGLLRLDSSVLSVGVVGGLQTMRGGR